MDVDKINQLLDYQKTFPASGELVFDELMVREYWLDLRYDVICILNDVFKCGYSPTAISNLFNSK